MAKLTVKGLDKLEKQLKDNVTLSDVKKVVRHNGAELQKKIQDHADFHGHYEGNRFVPPTGATKESVTLEITDGGLTATSGPTTEYADYLEYGTRFMQAQPFVAPALREQSREFFRDLRKLMR